MSESNKKHILALIERVGRLSQAEQWTNDLNPTQLAALKYLARANRFSRAPSHVADYLGATRGTVSQTLKALVRKGLIFEVRSETDRRSIRYDLHEAHKDALNYETVIANAIDQMPQSASSNLANDLQLLLHKTLQMRGGRSFGMCKSCKHHRPDSKGGAYCALLELDLKPHQANQICHEHSTAA